MHPGRQVGNYRTSSSYDVLALWLCPMTTARKKRAPDAIDCMDLVSAMSLDGPRLASASDRDDEYG